MTSVNKNLKIIQHEFIRKSIHCLIGLTPLLAVWNYSFTIVFIAAGIFAYVYFESMRLNGFTIPIISSLTAMAARPKDEGRFILAPVTLGFGALLVLVLFPPLIAAIAIFALAFGDGFASLIGKIFGRIRPHFLFGKSVEGSLACFLAVFIASWRVSQSLSVSLTAAITATIVEALPLGDFDNILVPLITAFVLFLI